MKMSVDAVNPIQADASRLAAEERRSNPSAQGRDSADAASRNVQESVSSAVAQRIAEARAAEEAKKAEETREPTGEELESAVSNLNDFVQTVRRDLAFSVDDDSGRTVVTVSDRQSGDVIRQIPSEEVLSIAARVREMGQEELKAAEGLILSAEA